MGWKVNVYNYSFITETFTANNISWHIYDPFLGI